MKRNFLADEEKEQTRGKLKKKKKGKRRKEERIHFERGYYMPVNHGVHSEAWLTIHISSHSVSTQEFNIIAINSSFISELFVRRR